MKLRVWYTAIFVNGSQHKAIVAARSRAEAGRLFGVSERVMRDYACLTGNENDIFTAMGKPKRVFINKNRMQWPMEWKELKR